MSKEDFRTGIDAKEYMNIRKVLSDKDYYLNTDMNSATVEDLMVLLKESVTGLTLPETSDKYRASILALYKENRENAYVDLMEYAENDDKLSKSTIDTLKVYADFCFYHQHPDLFNSLCMSVYNNGAPIKFGPIEMPGSTTFPRTYESTYRMLFYDNNRAAGRDGAKVEMFAPDVYPFLEDYMNKFKAGEPTSFYDAYAVFEYYKSLFILQQCSIGRRFTTHLETDSKRLDYYTSINFDASKISSGFVDGVDVGRQSSEPDLARDMSGYSYKNEEDSKIARKNRIRRKFFDAVAKTGELPNSIYIVDSERCSLRECLNVMGAEEFLNTADAGFYMHDNPRDYKKFLILQKIYDLHADTVYRNKVLDNDLEALEDVNARSVGKSDVGIDFH